MAFSKEYCGRLGVLSRCAARHFEDERQGNTQSDLLFYVGASIAGDERRLESLSRWLFFGGIAFGLYGITQWFLGLQEGILQANRTLHHETAARPK